MGEPRAISAAGEIFLLVAIDPVGRLPRAEWFFEVGQLQLGVGAEGNIQINDAGAKRLQHGPVFQVRAGLANRACRVDIVDDFNPNGRTAKARLDDIGAGKRWGAVLRQRHPVESGNPRCLHEPTKGQFVHADSSGIEAGAGVRNLEGFKQEGTPTAFSAAAVKTQQRRSKVEFF